MHLTRDIRNNLRRQQPLPQRLIATYRGFEAIEHSIRGLAILAREHSPLTYKSIFCPCVLARAELTRAPSFPWPITVPSPRPAVALADDRTALRELAHLAEDILLALVEASAQATEVADHRACTAGAINACLIQQALHHTADALADQEPHPG
ncbi:hypothetical protein [Thermomonospora cellulosilytica]|uniref:Uncharacterized protein n=1 Tax=Thermomonospora cellulosilytica TaxID=1411118 RepID=A0A7W3MVW3_9ACTN|nr:hypothetical protein [Thermomonospora cellulosilytica]MBA9002862.1 hypothetical protein [Thermomonospora cellulosilytica]